MLFLRGYSPRGRHYNFDAICHKVVYHFNINSKMLSSDITKENCW